jgi:hypothetical protein
MTMNKTSKILSAMLLTTAFGLSGSVFAAENAAGVAEHMDLTIKTTKEALEAAKSGNKEGCLAGIKQAKQHYKELTGDASGKPMQDAIKRMKDAQTECDAGNTAKAAEILGEVVASEEKVQASMKK